MENKYKKEKKFINTPQYPGGSKAFKNFIKDNLKYPSLALEKGIGGLVLLEFEVDDNGLVLNVNVIKGIGYGCDEEAIRLVKLLKYEKAKNHGIRVKSKVKTKISFVLPIKKQDSKLAISYTYTESSKPTNYSYSIKINKTS
ncbi:MAG: hypothetical protein A2X12_08050 [Bacteroidetes bacterium GWE2_29_8]|nr:MAG: hypothetical protein A2X12_08050 [Bacteroidetes bacterium GWE2_29_8]OFY22057.1 MAG: hypothetical protein A2X02_04420 [Bacteroidetes bacterium GWF2_29_10]